MIAVITAGGRVTGDLATAIGTPFKALAPWRGGALIDPVIMAARALGAQQIVVVAEAEVAAHCAPLVDRVIEAVADGRANLTLALQQAQADMPLLFLTCDLPFLQAADLEKFLACVGEADIAMPIASAQAYTAQFAGAPDHITQLGGENIANGSVFYFASGMIAQRAINLATELFAARKSLIKMALLLEIPLLLRFLLRRLKIQHIEAYAKRRFGLRALVVRNAAPSLCFDVDTAADWHFAQWYPHESQA